MNHVKKKEVRVAKKLVPTLSAIDLKRASLYAQRAIPTNDRKWKVIHAASPDGGYLATAVSKMVTNLLRHSDQEERQTDGSRHWETIGPTLVRAFARREARDFDDRYWLTLIHEGRNNMRIEYCAEKKWISLLFTSSKTLRWYSDKPRIDDLHAYSSQLDRAHLLQVNFVGFSVHFGEWIDSKRSPESTRVPHEQYSETHWKRHQDAF